jgi:hypothetical protein
MARDYDEYLDEDESFGPDYDYDDDEMDFADPGGNSALRAAGPSNPRNLPCPTCEAPNRLTPKDVALGYQCDACADRAERGGW